MEKLEILERLKNDEDYYGAFGKQYMSNSSLYNLLNNPKLFGVDEDETLAMVQGKYFHTCMLEPEKKGNFEIVQASTRTTNIYKEQSGDRLLLLQKEVDELDECISVMKGNNLMNSLIYAKGNQFEVPEIGELFELPFKGKADIISKNFVLDIKTTSDIRKFKYSAFNYNYDSQAYIYSVLFGKSLRFLVIDKTTKELGIFDCSDEFMIAGRKKVARAIDIYNKFFGPYKTEDVNQYLIEETL